jgi:hypothetical protein
LLNHPRKINPYIQKIMNNKLYNYVFWFNTYTDLWHAIPREQYIDFFSGEGKPTDTIKSKDINTLIFIINNPKSIK